MNSFVISEQNSSMLYVKMATNVLLDKVQTDWMGYLKKKSQIAVFFFYVLLCNKKWKYERIGVL